jgi:hypothetical protein
MCAQLNSPPCCRTGGGTVTGRSSLRRRGLVSHSGLLNPQRCSTRKGGSCVELSSISILLTLFTSLALTFTLFRLSSTHSLPLSARKSLHVMGIPIAALDGCVLARLAQLLCHVLLSTHGFAHRDFQHTLSTVVWDIPCPNHYTLCLQVRLVAWFCQWCACVYQLLHAVGPPHVGPRCVARQQHMASIARSRGGRRGCCKARCQPPAVRVRGAAIRVYPAGCRRDINRN